MGEAYLWSVTCSQVLDFDGTVSTGPGSRRFKTLLFLLDLEIEVLSDTLDAVERDLACRVEPDDPEDRFVERERVGLRNERYESWAELR
jgi:hypothetical protein